MRTSNLFTGLCLACLCCAVFPAQAQLSLGIKGGVNITGVTTDLGYLEGGIKNTFGLHAGVILEIPIDDHFAIQPELNWLQKGYAVENGAVTTKWIFNILDVHLLAKYNYNLGKVKGYVDAGPTFGPVLSGYREPDNADKITLDLDTDLIRKFDYGITAGLGFGLSLGSGIIFVDGRYMLSLNDIFEDAANKGKFRKVGFDYTLGYLFPLGS